MGTLLTILPSRKRVCRMHLQARSNARRVLLKNRRVPVCGTLLFFSKTRLAFDLACKCILQTLFLLGSIVKSVPIRRSDRCYNVSIEPVGHFHQLFFCKMLQIGEQLTLGSNNYIVLVGEGNIPLAAMD